jgi:hypothetical protein|tara:strand:+ start:1274 stop:2416 length:1143 start_codon:yes stop_codon:yes gene_type:complete
MKSLAAHATPLEIIRLCVMICFQLSKPKQNNRLVPVIWGGVGLGKSQLVQQIAAHLGYDLYDFRSSDKDPTDIGGTPVPDINSKTLEYYVSNKLIPFKRYDADGNPIPSKSKRPKILFLDEIDRGTIEVTNVELQLLLDGSVNGHELDDDVYIVCAGNGDSDIGTTPMSEAACTRLIHFYVDSTSDKAIEGWQNWAASQGLPDWAIAFAEVRKEVFAGEEVTFTERSKFTPRTYVWALDFIEKCEEIGGFAARPDVIKALVFGAIGQAAGQEAIAFRKLRKNVPDAESIIKDPDQDVPTCKDALGILYIAKQYLIDYAMKSGKEDKQATRAFIKYASRWPASIKAAFMRGAEKRGLAVAGLPEYQQWEEEQKAEGNDGMN